MKMPRSSVTAALLAVLGAAALGGCTIVKPIACALVFPIHQFDAKLEAAKRDDDADSYRELPPAATFAAAPVLIPLNYAYYAVYGAIGGLFSGFVSDLNLITGHGTLERSVETATRPLWTNAVRPEDRR